MTTDVSWRPVADLAEFGDRDVIGREVDGLAIALYRLDGAVYATADHCTHGSARLSAGEVVEGYVECPLHFGLFEIRTGKAAGAPVGRDLRTFPVRLDGTRIEVAIAG